MLGSVKNVQEDANVRRFSVMNIKISCQSSKPWQVYFTKMNKQEFSIEKLKLVLHTTKIENFLFTNEWHEHSVIDDPSLEVISKQNAYDPAFVMIYLKILANKSINEENRKTRDLWPEM